MNYFLLRRSNPPREGVVPEFVGVYADDENAARKLVSEDQGIPDPETWRYPMLSRCSPATVVGAGSSAPGLHMIVLIGTT